MKKILLGAVALALTFQMAAFAEVIVEKGERTGKWHISTPDGKQVVVDPKESLPAIQDNSNILVGGGEAKITTTGKSTVYLIESIPFKLLENTTIKRMQGDMPEVTIEVLAGQVTVTKHSQPGLVRATLFLDAGDQVRLAKGGNLDVISGEVVLSESSGKPTKFGAGKSLAGFAKSEPLEPK